MKVLFVTENKLMHYRMPIFRLVNNDPDIDLTLAHSEGSIIQNEIKEIIIPNDKIIGPFNRYKNFRQICSEYDVVLCMAYYNNLAILKELICRKKTYKIILWGIGVRASYQHKFGAKSPYGKMIKFFSKRADALLFYSDFPIPLYCNYGIEKERLFVANNTVEVIHQNMDISSKDRFLFVGTLYKEKGIDVLINAYSQAFSIDKNILRLTIIGDGDRIKYEKLVKELNLEDKIDFTGGIYDEVTISSYFKKALLCISPNQAGLSVLKSLGYGVPFVTASDAITGGERLNVISGVTGFYCDNQNSIADIIIDASHNVEKYFKIGQSAYDYYWHKRTPQIMANGIIDSIKYVINK